jgi:hypothetical protein
VSLGTVIGSEVLTLTPAMLHTVRPGSGQLKAASLASLSLPVDQVRTAQVLYRSSAVVSVLWQ